MTLVHQQYGDEGNLLGVSTRQKDNIIVDNGFDLICDALGKAVGRPDVISHIEAGSGVTAPVSGDDTLESTLLRKVAVYAHTAGTKIFTMSVTFAAGEATGPITEAGVFNAAADGIMLDRVTFAVINKGANDTLTVTFTFTLS